VNSLQLQGDGGVGTSDTITIDGFKNDGSLATVTYYVNTDAKVQEFLDAVGTAFGCTATIDAYGRLKMTDLTAGNSGMFVTSVVVDGAVTGPATQDDASPFGESGVNGDTVINITTSKQKIFSTGQGLSAGGVVPVITANTPWQQVFDSTGTGIVDGDVFTFNGFASDGTPVINQTYTVDAVISPTNTGTVQDMLEWLETVFSADAEIDFAGRLVLTDRVADEAAATGYHSQLAMTSVSDGSISGADPWGNGLTPFLTLLADVSGEDGSLQGGVVSADFAPEALASTQYANSSTTIFQDQNGYASGFLQAVAVNTEGIITGNYSNGQVLKKAQVALANFASLEGLFKKGGNIFTETTESGAPVTGAPGSNGLGTIAPNALEMSNVDIGTEFVNLITVQRGFQANTKIVTTTDEMISDVINMKR